MMVEFNDAVVTTSFLISTKARKRLKGIQYSK
jgi:hypothetical protein